ncbi:MAG: TIGR03936 family radical SAM-associated protein [Actinobacteria bacterium]|nr:TIGR03936 family radical SAM-associated protein [Actinomycetota bacterium]
MDKHFYRLRIVVGGEAAFTSQNDETRVIERAMRRLDLPIAFTQGFSPKPILSFGPARPTGFGSLSDLVEICLLEDFDPQFLKKGLNNVLPEGFFVLEVQKIKQEEFGSLNALIEEARTGILIEDPSYIPSLLANLNTFIDANGEFYFDNSSNQYFLRILREAISNGKIEKKEEGVFIFFKPPAKAKSAARIDKFLINFDIKQSLRGSIKRCYIFEYRLKG